MSDERTIFVDYVGTLINDCGTACETAEIAARLRQQIQYLSTAGAGATVLAYLRHAYSLLGLAIADAAGLSDDEFHVLDAAIATFSEMDAPHG